MKANLSLLVMIFILCGCGTFASLEHRKESDPLIFGGARMNIEEIRSSPNSNIWLRKQKFYNPYVDMPVSFITDVVLLPYTVPYALLNRLGPDS